MEFSYLDPRAKRSWVIGRSLVLAVLLCVAAAVWFAFIRGLGGNAADGFDGRWIFFLVCGVLFAPLIVNAYLLPFYQYLRHKYLIADDRVELIEGVVIRTHTVIPILRIQHVVVSAGPINQLMGLSDVAIHTASGVHNIPELDSGEAQRLCALLKERINQRLGAEAGS